MTCPTCNGSMMLPNPNGIGVVACTDCKDGKIKRSNMKNLDTTLAKIVFVLCLIAWMLWPKQAGAQTQLSIEDVKKCVAFDGHIKTSIFGILDVTYAKAISEGKTNDEAVKIAAYKLGEILDGLSGLDEQQGAQINDRIVDASEIRNMPVPISEIKANAIGDITSSPTGFWMMDADTVGFGATKKDTILVPVLCQFRTWVEVYEPTTLSSSPSNHKKSIEGVRVEIKAQERTLEWQFVEAESINPIKAGSMQWVVTETRWIENVERCFQITPLQNTEK